MSKKKILAAAVVAALSTGMIGSTMSQALAADTPPKAMQGSGDKKAAEDDLVKVSEDAAITLRNVRRARLAIFNGMPEKAQVYTDAAVTRVLAALKDADKYALDAKIPPKEGEVYVPVHASLAIDESFVPSDAKMKEIDKANKHLHRGEARKAMEVLKLAEIDVALSTELFPLKWAKSRIDEAAKLIGEGKYYEANLALKRVEDSLVIETFAVDDIPKAKGGS